MLSVNSFLFVSGLLVLVSFVLCGQRLLNVLMVMENMKVLVLVVCLLGQIEECRMLFLSLMVIFTIEVTVSLVVISRLWSSSFLIDMVGL